MNDQNHIIRIRIPYKFLKLTIIGMIVAMISGIVIADAQLSTMQYFAHYATMLISSICFVKAVSSIHAYEIEKDTKNEKEITSTQQG